MSSAIDDTLPLGADGETEVFALRVLLSGQVVVIHAERHNRGGFQSPRYVVWNHRAVAIPTMEGAIDFIREEYVDQREGCP